MPLMGCEQTQSSWRLARSLACRSLVSRAQFSLVKFTDATTIKWLGGRIATLPEDSAAYRFLDVVNMVRYVWVVEVQNYVTLYGR